MCLVAHAQIVHIEWVGLSRGLASYKQATAGWRESLKNHGNNASLSKKLHKRRRNKEILQRSKDYQYPRQGLKRRHNTRAIMSGDINHLFTEKIPADCQCSICHGVLRDAKETTNCQHAFCGPCIDLWLTEHSNCPVCRNFLLPMRLGRLHRVWREKLEGLQLRCPNHIQGCEKNILFGNLDEHLKECLYGLVPCPHSSCTELVMRSVLSDHVLLCDYRSILCSVCNLSIPAESMKNHDCISALKDDMRKKLDKLEEEWVELKTFVETQTAILVETVQSQETEIEYLKNLTLYSSEERLPQGHSPERTSDMQELVHTTGTRRSSSAFNPLPGISRWWKRTSTSQERGEATGSDQSSPSSSSSDLHPLATRTTLFSFSSAQPMRQERRERRRSLAETIYNLFIDSDTKEMMTELLDDTD